MVGRINHLAEVGLILSRNMKQSCHIIMIDQEIIDEVFSITSNNIRRCSKICSMYSGPHEIPSSNRPSVAIHDCVDIATLLLSSCGIFTAALNFEYLTACYVFRIVEIKKSVKIVRHYSNDK